MLTHIFSEVLRQLGQIMLHSYCIVLHTTAGENRFMPVPDCFVWTRFGTEAGQSIADIVRRKEDERAANGGVFYWGIGNAIGPSMIKLLRQLDAPEVLFSPIKSSPRKQDVAPESIVAWTAASGLDGEPYRLPARSLITSRFNRERSRHYALVCKSDTRLQDLFASSTSADKIQFSELRNILSGRPLGSSQVTAVVQRQSANAATGPQYDVSLKAKLVPPYLIHLSGPKPISTTAGNFCDWTNAVTELWRDGCKSLKA